MASKQTRDQAEQLMCEVAAASGACGRPIGRRFIDTMLGLTEKMTPYRTSMKIDHELGRPMEVEAIFGAPLAAATAAGCQCPQFEALYRRLKSIDAK